MGATCSTKSSAYDEVSNKRNSSNPINTEDKDLDDQTKVNLIENVFGSTDLHCHILSYVDVPSLIQSELVNKAWNLHAKNPACVSQLNFKHCYNHKGFSQTYFTHGENTAGKKIQQISRGVLSSAKYFFTFPKEYDPNDINNKEYMSNITRFRQSESLTIDLSDKLNQGLKSIKFHSQQISHRKNEQHRLLNQIGQTFKTLKKISIRFDERRESACFDLLKQILITSRTNIKYVKIVCTNALCRYDVLLPKITWDITMIHKNVCLINNNLQKNLIKFKEWYVMLILVIN